MSLKRMEALADAIASLNDYHNPESEAYRLRNPGMLKAKTLASLGTATDDCTRTFTCHQAGYKCLTDLLRKKCERFGTSTIKDTLAHFQHGSEFEVADGIDFMRRSLCTKISPDTKLDFFTE